MTAVTVTSESATMIARAATRPSAPDAAIDPTLATSIDATSGMTVLRIRLMKIVPTGAAMARIAAVPGIDPFASARPRRKPATRPAVYESGGASSDPAAHVDNGRQPKAKRS